MFYITKKIRRKYNGKSFDERICVTIRHNIILNHASGYKTIQKRTVDNVLCRFIFETGWRNGLAEKIKRFVLNVRYIKRNLKYQKLLFDVREDVLDVYWKKECEHYRYDLSQSDMKEDKFLFTNFNKTPVQLIQKLLGLWMKRCREHHILTFYKYRKACPTALQPGLDENFK